MINQLLKLGALLATGRFLKPRLKGLIGIALTWGILWFLHSEFISYVELSGDTRYVLIASALKILFYALSIGIYVALVERPLWPKPVIIPSTTAQPVSTKSFEPGATLPAGDDGFDFLREKKNLQNATELLTRKK